MFFNNELFGYNIIYIFLCFYYQINKEKKYISNHKYYFLNFCKIYEI